MSEWLKNIGIVIGFIGAAVGTFIALKRWKPEVQNVSIDGAQSAVAVVKAVMDELKIELDRRDKECEKRIGTVEFHHKNCETRVSMLEAQGRKMRTALSKSGIPFES